MLTLLGRPERRSAFCDGLNRRNFLKIGGMVMGGLTLPQLLRAEAEQHGVSGGRSHKAVINIFLPGGPPHQDMWDVKLDAPSEIRGEFKAIPTNVSGIEICELFPMLAGMMDRLVPIRSIVGAGGGHVAYECMHAYRENEPGTPAGGRPSAGAWVSKVLGPLNGTVPPNVTLM